MLRSDCREGRANGLVAVRRLLITTALEETWGEGVPVLFLGEWCRRYSRKQRWLAMDAEVLPYHWDDRDKLYADYVSLQQFHERLLVDIADQLNRIHGVDHSVRYWRILIGVWLGYFTQMLFDRWCSINQATEDHDLSGHVVFVGHEAALVPNAMVDFVPFFLGDEWNQHIYAAILRQFPSVPTIERRRTQSAPSAEEAGQASWKQQVRTVLGTAYSRAAQLLARDDDALFAATYLPFSSAMRLQMRLRQAPQRWSSVPPTVAAVDWKRREWVVDGDSQSAFEAFARTMVSQQIPRAYLEGYSDLVEQTQRLPLPPRPKLIWSSNAFIYDDVFKAWAAEKAEQGSRIVVGQHGGHYGVGRWSFVEDHEVAISDRYLSWGWTEVGQPTIVPVGQLKSKAPLGVRHADKPRALMVECVAPRQSYMMYSVVVARQWLDYFEDQCAFVENLSASVQEALTVRLKANDYGWDQAARWSDRFPDIRLDSGNSNIDALIRESRLYISTYNATTYLESFTMDVPTVIFWNPNHWELRESAIPYFEELEAVGIFHKTPESAARHVVAIWDDVDAWWTSPEVRQVLDRFKKRYCHLPTDLLHGVERALRESMDVSEPTGDIN